MLGAASGARPLKRAIQRLIETPLSRKLLADDLRDGQHVRVDLEGEELTLRPADRPGGADILPACRGLGTQTRGGRQSYPALGGTCVTPGSPADRHSLVIGHWV
ncbi:MAG: hypothetical protein GW911_26410 [Armatimonadetes bacterium]|nr:hypothetical protein [Armatimonadota bacterium]NCO91349.1 hypothetical protein [Armatimonadota bacterium]NDK15578.1 hypothetical protein [Armatimonadota bacterium]